MSETLLKEINLPNIVKCLNSKIYFPCHPRPHQKIFMEVLRSLDSFFTDTENEGKFHPDIKKLITSCVYITNGFAKSMDVSKIGLWENLPNVEEIEKTSRGTLVYLVTCLDAFLIFCKDVTILNEDEIFQVEVIYKSILVSSNSGNQLSKVQSLLD